MPYVSNYLMYVFKLSSSRIHILIWPPYSPDLSP